jgi:HSP20 family molecular chaperone IbpA
MIGTVVEHIRSLNKKLMFNQNKKLMSILLKNDPFSIFVDSLINNEIQYLSNRVVSKVQDGKLEIAVSVLGHDPKKVNVELTEDRIFIKSAVDKENKSVTSALIGDIDEVLKLSRDYNGLSAKATIENGILLIVVDKKDEAKPKKLTIKF